MTVSRWGDDPRERKGGTPHYLEYPKVSERDQQDHKIPQEAGERQVYFERDREYRLNQAETAVIRDVGRFRRSECRKLPWRIWLRATAISAPMRRWQ